MLKDLRTNEKEASREYALLHASQKAAELAQQSESFQKKYQMSFEDFEKRLRSQDKEIFEEEDDYLAWQFAVEGVAYWREKIEQLKSTS
ncbi:hypothetical protein GWO43_09500 [candidate division KSB1 bacterium]|nr:hypothetical protein [candidate division KSB1 bacterium]NIR69382.1 hypothetical protein [candidate division KSB1 bacterium]NIS24200.1 hypothetical protein [candidate division KSB1 bacterium]NIT71115.1 hypothetical protein [candidate division KSB1 bacterium]NIU24819.1 hypothetical protein [candidate division KSB1 bacterium]